MESFTGFSKEDIEKYHHTLEIIDNSAEIPTNLKKISRNDKDTVTSINKCTLKTYERSCLPGKLSPQNYRPIPSEARLKALNKNSLNHEDNGSSSSPDFSSSISSHSLASRNQNEDTSSVESEGVNSNAVTIIVGDDKSYEVISTLSTEVSPAINSSNIADRELPQKLLQKAFLLKRDEDKCKESPLKVFQERQKQMEELNNKRKELLKKAIADRKRQTQFEAKKLLQLQDELNQLDALLSTDVGILRNQIELASSEFNEAQKRYDRAENEFIEAKLHLFSKLERKELLTEHLCRIIEVNEQRKAKKLSELMARLELTEDCSSVDLTLETAVTPEAVGVSQIPYEVYSTLKPLSRSRILKESQKASCISSLMKEIPSSSPVDPTAFKGCVALKSINLITAQNLDHRSESSSYDLNSSD